jgi:hypothetical protein
MKTMYLLALVLLAGSALAQSCTSSGDCSDDDYCGAGGTCVPIDRPGDSPCCGPVAVLALVSAGAAFARQK